ncbi:hypothetical protein EAY64_02185 [Aquitalea palustris]|uniref:Lipoprotein n=1 Tax=Aquitalea palustris TaxID=2480983 RepID=A0A454JMW1_9NEIS|nr:hypothetical protein [Aquitalea palustris]RMD01529.1 hypothetical protein EAY64_02185 [Aquitalea palustris]
MNKSHLATLLASLLAVSACTQQQSDAAQQAASAAISTAHATLSDTSAPLATLRQQASAAAGEAKQQAAQLVADNPALGLAVSAVQQGMEKSANALQWQQLETKVGSYPADIGLYQKGVVAEALHQLLGKKMPVFLQNMQVSSPLGKDQLLFVSGNKAHQGGEEMAYLLLDPASKQLEVGLIEQRKLRIYRSGPPLYRPAEINTMLDNLAGQP